MTSPTPAPGAPTDPAPTAPTSAPATTPTAGPDPNAPVDVASLPANVQQLISKLRGEAGAARTQAKTKAAEDARAELMQQISTALGLQEAPADPAILADQLASTRLAEASTRLEYNVFRTALDMVGLAGAKRLLDSRSFADAVDELPDEDFDDALKALIEKRATEDPALSAGGAAAPAGRRPVENLRSGALPASDSGAFDPDSWIRRQAGIS